MLKFIKFLSGGDIMERIYYSRQNYNQLKRKQYEEYLKRQNKYYLEKKKHYEEYVKRQTEYYLYKKKCYEDYLKRQNKYYLYKQKYDEEQHKINNDKTDTSQSEFFNSSKTGNIEDKNINDENIKNNSYSSLESNIEESNLKYKKDDSAQYDKLENKNCISVEGSCNEEFLEENYEEFFEKISKEFLEENDEEFPEENNEKFLEENDEEFSEENYKEFSEEDNEESLEENNEEFLEENNEEFSEENYKEFLEEDNEEFLEENDKEFSEEDNEESLEENYEEFFGKISKEFLEENDKEFSEEDDEESLEESYEESLEESYEESLEESYEESLEESYEEFSEENDKELLEEAYNTVAKEEISKESNISTKCVYVKFPVILAVTNITIPIEANITFDQRVMEIKEIKKNLFLTQSRLVPFSSSCVDPNSGVLFIAGFIKKNIEYKTQTCTTARATSVCGDIRHCTVEMPFNFTTRITFLRSPIFTEKTTTREVEFFTETPKVYDVYEDPVIGRDPCEQSSVFTEVFNEKPFVEPVKATFIEVDIHNNPILSCEIPEEQTFTEITEKSTVNLTLKVLQKQQLRISIE
jgi:hypothetical protein